MGVSLVSLDKNAILHLFSQHAPLPSVCATHSCSAFGDSTDTIYRSEGRIGFDQSKAHPALFDLILGPDADRLGIPSKGKAVVPGCGRVSRPRPPHMISVFRRSPFVDGADTSQGYDVDLLSKKGLDALGVDISPTGVKAAQE